MNDDFSMSYFSILVVEDHPYVRQYIRSLVQQRAEFRVVGQASDGTEAVELARRLQPDVILMDIGLPKLSGIDAAKQILTLDSNVKILFVSLETSHELVRETLRLGAQGYIHKQSARNELLLAIEEVLSGKEYVSSDLGFQKTDA